MSDYRLEFWPDRAPGGPIAFLTMARDEDFLMRAWILNGLRISPDAAFFVLDHASNPPLSDSLADFVDRSQVNISFIKLPAVPFDDDFKAMSISGFAKVLLHCYDIVVSTDCDELLVGFGIGPSDVLERLRSSAEIVAPIGFEIVQHTGEEKPFDPSQAIEQQRSFGFFASGYTKPVIWKKRTEFGAGLHSVRDNFSYDRSLGLLHLRSVDEKVSLERAAQRRIYELSEGQVSRGRDANWVRPHDKKMDFFARLRSMESVPSSDEVIDLFMTKVNQSHNKNAGGFWGHNISMNSEYCNVSGLLYA